MAKDALSEWYGAHRRAVLVGITLFLLLVPIVLAVWFRSYPATLPVTKEWAAKSLQTSIKNQISAQVAQQYPNLPPQNRETLVREQVAQYLKEHELQDQVAATAALFRGKLQDDHGQTYLLAIDPYQFLRYVEDELDHGYPGDTLRDGKPYDKHMLAPIGTFASSPLHVSFGVWLYKLVSLVKQTEPMAVFFWLPVIFAALAVIPAFFLAKRYGLLAAFFAATLVAVHSGFIGRTAAGFADTDAYVVLMPLLCGWLFFEALNAREWKRSGLFLGLTGLAFGIFSRLWEWWYFFDVFLVMLVAYLAFLALRGVVRKERSWGEFRHAALLALGFLVAVGLFVSLFSSFSFFLHGPFNAVYRVEGIQAAVHLGDIWPNVFTTVAELNKPSISQIIGTIGGRFLFVLALLGILATLLPERLGWKEWALLGFGLVVGLYLSGKGSSLSIFSFLIVMSLPVALAFLLLLREDRDVKYALFLFIWMAASVFTMTKGVRFILLLIPPFALAAGVAVGVAFRLARAWLESVELRQWWVSPLLFLLFALLLLPPIHAGRQTGMREVPSMSDAWWNTLSKIKAESAPDAIINSWWDFGHWFKYVADRAVTFDGASQNTPMAHWIGRVLLTNNEQEALAILRMLDCGSSLAVQEVQEGLPSHDQYEAIMLTKRIIMLPRDEARQALLDAGVQNVAVVLNHTHCDPPEDYFITSQDMVGKGSVWGHFGSWNFTRADAYTHFHRLPQSVAVQKMEEKYGWTPEEASKVYYEMETLPNQRAVNGWISPWPGYPTDWKPCRYVNESVVCSLRLGVGNQNGVTTVLDSLVVNLSSRSGVVRLVGYRGGVPVGGSEVEPSVLVLVNDSMERVELHGTFRQAFLLDLRATPRVLMTDPLNVDSMFTRLFFLDGFATGFQKFSDETAFNLGRILVWKINWSALS